MVEYKVRKNIQILVNKYLTSIINVVWFNLDPNGRRARHGDGVDVD